MLDLSCVFLRYVASDTVLAMDGQEWCPSRLNAWAAQVLYNTQFYDVIAEHQKICICFSAPSWKIGRTAFLCRVPQVRLSRI